MSLERMNNTLKVGGIRIFEKWPVGSVETGKHFSKISPEWWHIKCRLLILQIWMDNQRLIQNEKLLKNLELVNVTSTNVTSGVQDTHLFLWVPNCSCGIPLPLLIIELITPHQMLSQGGGPQPDNDSRTPIFSPIEGTRTLYLHW